MDESYVSQKSTEVATITPSTWLVSMVQKSTTTAGTVQPEEPVTCSSYEEYKRFVVDAVRKSLGAAELYFFVVLWVTEKDGELPVLGNKFVFEFNLLAPFRRESAEGNAERPDIHVFLFAIYFDINEGKQFTDTDTKDSRREGEIMLPELKGVMLYKYDLHSCLSESDFKSFFDTLKAVSASAICSHFEEKLLDKNLMAAGIHPLKVGLPKGRISEHLARPETEVPSCKKSSDNFALLINLLGKEAEGDADSFKSICSLLGIDKERHLSIIREESWTSESAREEVIKNCNFIKEKLEPGKNEIIWVFLTAHGDHDGVKTYEDGFTCLDDLLKSFFEILCDREKVFFVDACRGPRDNQWQELTGSPRSSRGLIFRNEAPKLDSTPKSGSDGSFILPSRGWYFAIFGSLPGYRTYQYNNDKGKSIGHLMMSTEAAMKKLRGKSVTMQELAEFIQCELSTEPPRGNEVLKQPQLIVQQNSNVSSEVSPSDDDPIIIENDDESGSLDLTSNFDESPSADSDPENDNLSTRQIQNQARSGNQQKIEIVSNSSTDSDSVTDSVEQ